MQRNGQNPTRAVRTFVHGSKNASGAPAASIHGENVTMVCPSCKAEIKPKPGFRVSSVKCPACGIPAVKK